MLWMAQIIKAAEWLHLYSPRGHSQEGPKGPMQTFGPIQRQTKPNILALPKYTYQGRSILAVPKLSRDNVTSRERHELQILGSPFQVMAVQKCMKFNVDVPIWLSKQRILCTLNQSLKDVLNYGLFQPAYNGKAGKFLDEERPLREYPFPSIAPVPYLEVSIYRYF
ncbi:SH3 and multiple ankyrin repeat domains protein 1 [Merluccius polli]|uniref:SH3 and multiple ankyrin repeat domains protein 1 n=1 Tax=Merluccius polli TaxID=89951 RepID=A0AA47MED5_MERPO|nr:SH3 and multiple ankyrin repeat domains protein 1 [Merluccius polli]